MEATSLTATCLQSCVHVQATDVVCRRKSRMCLLISSQPISRRDVQAEMWVGWHVRMPTCTLAVLSAGFAGIHSVTMNTYCEKEKELPHVLT